MKLKVLKLHESAILPQYAHPNDTGLVLFNHSEEIIL